MALHCLLYSYDYSSPYCCPFFLLVIIAILVILVPFLIITSHWEARGLVSVAS